MSNFRIFTDEQDKEREYIFNIKNISYIRKTAEGFEFTFLNDDSVYLKSSIKLEDLYRLIKRMETFA